MRYCKIHSRTYNSKLNRWFDVQRGVLESFSHMLTMTENVCDLCQETQKNSPFIIEPELW